MMNEIQSIKLDEKKKIVDHDINFWSDRDHCPKKKILAKIDWLENYIDKYC